MISRLDREKEVNEKDELKKYRQDACHVFYKKLRNEITSFVSLNWKLKNDSFTNKPFRLIEIPIILQSQIRQHNSLLLYFLKWLTGLLTEIVKFFFINDQYRWEFNYVLTWLLIDVIGRRQRKIKAVEIRKRKHDKQKKVQPRNFKESQKP